MPCDEFWEDANGKTWKLHEMERRHLRNAVGYTQRRLADIGDWAPSGYRDDELAEAEHMAEAFTIELERREAMHPRPWEDS